MVEIFDGCPQAISRSLIPEIPSLEVGLISRRVHHLGLLQRDLFLSIQGSSDFLSNSAGYSTLERERVAEISFVTFCPDLFVNGDPDQLGRDPYAITRMQHASFNHGIDIQLTGNLGQRLASALIGHRGRARDHTYRADLPEVGDQFVGHSIGEIILGRIVGKVFQRQHCQGMDRG